MRTATKKAENSPAIHLAISSGDVAQEAAAQLSLLGCNCKNHNSLAELQQLLATETPDFVMLSLDSEGQCALQYCRKHPLLMKVVPVGFVTADPSSTFEKALEAIRLGAVDVLTPPLSYEKLAKVVKTAKQGSAYEAAAAQSNFACDESVDLPQHVSDQTISAAANAQPSAADSESNGNREVYITHDQPPRPAVAAATGHDRFVEAGREINEPCPNLERRRESHAANVQELETWILGSSAAMRTVRSIIAEVAETKANVMIYGASGTGKELVATAVHKLSERCNGPFEPVNMTEIPHDLAESLLFGHEKGSFTGADYRQIGVCEAADGGTLFLDEIGEMALATQPKLLRFLQEGTVKRIGSPNLKQVDVRVITATNRSPATIVKEGLLREDLFFRLHVVPIHIPPLQERPEDIEELAMLFLHRYVEAYGRSVEGFTAGALQILRQHDWPGNVRQLENVIERLVVFAKGRWIDVLDIPSEIHAASMFDDVPDSASRNRGDASFARQESQAFGEDGNEAAAAIASMSAIQRTERTAIVEALQRCDGHVIDAAKLLGLGQATVYRKIKQYHIPHQRRRRRRTPK